MNLTWRPMEVEDIEACSRRPLLDEAAYDAETRAVLPRLWRELIQAGGVETGLLEDQDGIGDARLVGFAFIVFLTDEFMAEAKASPAPYINRRIVDRWLAGRSPILSLDAVRAGNSGAGLNQHTFHESLPPTFDGPTPMLDKIIELYFQLSLGYRFQEVSIEVYGHKQLQMNLNGGFRIRNDYGLPPDERAGDQSPFLIGLTRDESRAAVGSIVSQLFSATRPCFGFHRAEQEMLRYALLGRSDEELAQALCLSQAAIRKRWLSIFGRVARVAPTLLPQPSESASGDQKRGSGKRHHLLSYLRSHLEELRPFGKRGGTEKSL